MGHGAAVVGGSWPGAPRVCSRGFSPCWGIWFFAELARTNVAVPIRDLRSRFLGKHLNLCVVAAEFFASLVVDDFVGSFCIVHVGTSSITGVLL